MPQHYVSYDNTKPQHCEHISDHLKGTKLFTRKRSQGTAVEWKLVTSGQGCRLFCWSQNKLPDAYVLGCTEDVNDGVSQILAR